MEHLLAQGDAVASLPEMPTNLVYVLSTHLAVVIHLVLSAVIVRLAMFVYVLVVVEDSVFRLVIHRLVLTQTSGFVVRC